jgi:hypothetical protein
VIHAGYDAREAIGFHVFNQSVIETSPGVGVLPLVNLAPRLDGSNAFTYSRFALFELYRERTGPVLFVDGSDMLLRSDVQELLDCYNPHYAVQVVKHKYKTKHPRKYVGTSLECDNRDYPCKNWSSAMLINPRHPGNLQGRGMIGEAMALGDGAFLHRFGWLCADEIGELPIEWNWLADEYGENPNAKLLHWTAGIPGFTHYAGAPHAKEWHETAERMMGGAK